MEGLFPVVGFPPQSRAGSPDATLFRRAPGLLLGIAFLQLPFVAQQFVILVPARKGLPGIVPADIVAGTFGGSAIGGGANSLLALYLLSVIAVLIALWRSGALAGRRWLLSAAGLLMPPLFLNESKASMVLLVDIFSGHLPQRHSPAPDTFCWNFLGVGYPVGCTAIFLHHDQRQGREQDPIYYLEHAIEQNVSEGYRYGAYNLNRVTALVSARATSPLRCQGTPYRGRDW